MRIFPFRLRRPRSFLGLVLSAFITVTLPLAGALLYSAWNTEHLAGSSTTAVFNAAQAARASRLLVNRIGSMTRLAEQLTVVNDDGMARGYAQLHEDFTRVADELARLPLDERQLAALRRTVEAEGALYDVIRRDPATKPDAEAVRARVDALTDDANAVLSISYLVADREAGRLQTTAEQVQRRLIMLGAFSTAVALAVVLALTRLVARPISQLEEAIRQLGRAEFAKAITVGGPEDLHNLGERLDWLRQRLAELEEQKNRFLRHLSHELKTPLSSLREGVELLNDRVAGPLVQSQQQIVAIMRENTLRLQDMIEELLDYQRALHAAAALDMQPVHLDELVRETVAAHRLAAQAREQRIELETVPVRIEADAAKLRSILDNMLGNALKFTPTRGSVTVTLSSEGEDAVIDVLDTGPGVRPEERESIFELFFRGHSPALGRVAGTGLGLAIVREFTEAHGGRVSALASGRGGHFRVLLPLRRAQAAREAA
jgi:two-component system, NtrC family, sensor histidine kinase GlrK